MFKNMKVGKQKRKKQYTVCEWNPTSDSDDKNEVNITLENTDKHINSQKNTNSKRTWTWLIVVRSWELFAGERVK